MYLLQGHGGDVIQPPIALNLQDGWSKFDHAAKELATVLP